ncbi:MAG: exodeoxyribonuclease I [Candidatus Nomurabacteria bacterium]|jgi:exodeoxyribonuclease-1|nr:exodeoxyribonuclease I [Candidatus Nomurabacteria bacterium]
MKTFFFYDLETSGLNPREDRIMQFAGQRTDMGLNLVGDPVNLLVRLSDDTLPSPYALMVTGITPQQTVQDGVKEAELAKAVYNEFMTPDTITVGYNNIRFDDEFLRYHLWRNFHDPYEWAWSQGRSRWDLLDVVRMTRALRPDGIEWPVVDGKAVNKLELLTKVNGISHQAAHDALSDVTALIDVARLLKNKQPQLFDWLFKLRDKNEVKKLVNLDGKHEFVYSSGRYDAEFNKTTVAFPLTAGRNGNVVVYDLRHDPSEFIKMDKKQLADALFSYAPTANSSRKDNADKLHGSFSTSSAQSERSAPRGTSMPAKAGVDSASMAAPSDLRSKGYDSEKDHRSLPRPAVKELQYNRCPAVAPLGVLEQGDGWAKIGLTAKIVAENKQKLLAAPDFAERVREVFESRPEFTSGKDPEAQLYDSFVSDRDKVRVEAVRNATEDQLADFNPDFTDERLPELLVHFKARNYPKALSEDEAKQWEKWRGEHIAAQSGRFVSDLQKLSATASKKQQFILQELQLWLENVAGSCDY